PAPSYTTPTTAGASPANPKELQLPIPASVTGSLSPGARLDQVEAFSFQVNGPPGAEALMDEIDATRSVRYTVGSGREPAGSVQLSVDDPSFAFPFSATLAASPGSGWTAVVPTAGLAPGR